MNTVKRFSSTVLMIIGIAILFSFSISLVLTSTKTSAGAPTCTWTGGGGASTNFSVTTNWTCDAGTVPVDGTTLIFPTTSANRVGVNNLSASIIYSGILFTGHPADCTYGAGFPYTLSGTAMKLAGDILDTNGRNCSYNTTGNTTTRFGSQIILNSNSKVETTSPIKFPNGFALGSYTLNLNRPSGFSDIVQFDIGSYNAGFVDAFTGSGTVNVNGQFVRLGAPSPSFTGNFNVTDNAYVYVGDSGSTWTTATHYNQSLGTATINLSGTSNLDYVFFSGFAPTAITIPNNFVISSIGIAEYAQLSVAWSDSTPNTATITPIIGASYRGWNKQVITGRTVTFSGAMSLATTLKMGTQSNVALTGALSGPGNTITIENSNSQSTAGTILVNGSSNTTATPNSTITPLLTTITLTSSFDSNNPQYVGRFYKLNLGGMTDVGAILLQNGGILAGSGTTGAITVQGSKIAVGNSPGLINSGNLSYDSTSSMDVEIGGTVAGTGYDQINVTGTVTLGSATLNLAHVNSFIPAQNDTFIIINNDGSDAVTGTFAGKAQGSTISADGVTYGISYVGGTGNDVVLTALILPGAPNTAGALAKPVNIAIAAVVIITGIGALILRKKYLTTTRRVSRSRK